MKNQENILDLRSFKYQYSISVRQPMNITGVTIMLDVFL